MSDIIPAAGVLVPDILHCNFLPVRQASRQISQVYDEYLREIELTAAQFVIVAFLHSNPGMTMQQLGVALKMERSSLVRAIQPLARDNYVTNQRGTGRRARQYFLYLTGSGEQKYRQGLPLWGGAQLASRELLGESLATMLLQELSAFLHD
jgi:DNA-binding MarR family transcriptional regulator